MKDIHLSSDEIIEQQCTDLLPRAIELAHETHINDLDLAGAPYMGHVLRVMSRMRTDAGRVVGVLHDFLEHGGKEETLRKEGFPEEIIIALQAVSRKEGESYKQFIARAAKNRLARWAKHADLTDNKDLSRIAKPSEVDFRRTAKYERAIRQIESVEESERTAGIEKGRA